MLLPRMKVCRADRGNTKGFTCTYHGWAYGIDGALVSVPNLEDGYYNELDVAQWGLVPVTQVDSYKGLVFALGPDRAAARVHRRLQVLLRRDVRPRSARHRGDRRCAQVGVQGELEVRRRAVRSDMYHAPISHASAVMAMASDADLTPEEAADYLDAGGRQFTSASGHGTGFFISPMDRNGGVRFMDEALRDYYVSSRRATIERLGVARVQGPMNADATFFPSFSYLPGTNTLRCGIPGGRTQMEVYSWIIVEKSMPPEVKEAQRLFTLRTFSPSGLARAGRW